MSVQPRLARADVAAAQEARPLVGTDVSMRVLEAAISALALVAALLLGLGH